MTIIEQTIVPKNPAKKSEDGIVVTPDFIAVIDGSTSKTDRRYSHFVSNGHYAMQLVSRFLSKTSKDASCQQFCNGVTSYIRRHETSIISRWKWGGIHRLADHPEERLTASAIVYSRLRREIWMIGDCQCLVGSQYYDNPKPTEAIVAQKRCDVINSSPKPWDHFLIDDTARQTVIPELLESMKQQNKTYAVIDGFPIPQQHVRVLTLDFQPWEIVLASDGYPWLCPTLAESEARLQWQRNNDPLNIGEFKATKAFMQGNNSFDDRAYKDLRSENLAVHEIFYTFAADLEN